MCRSAASDDKTNEEDDGSIVHRCISGRDEIEGKVVEEQEGIEQVADARRNGTAQLYARTLDGVLRFDNLGDSLELFIWG